MLIEPAADARLRVALPFRFNGVVKTLPGRVFDPATKTWTIPATATAAYRACMMVKDLGLAVSEIHGDVRALAFESVHRRTLIERPAEEFPAVEMPGATPFRHQTKAIHLIGASDATYLAWDAGTGKTLAVIGAVCRYRFPRTLIVCTKNIVAQWQRQWARFAYGETALLPLSEGSVEARAKKLERMLESGRPFVAVINYEAAWRPQFAAVIESVEWDAVVLDEIHRIAAERGKASTFFQEFRGKAKRRIGLSGTPGLPLSIWAQLRFLDPGLFGTYSGAFKQKYCVMGGFKSKAVMAYRNLEEFGAQFRALAYPLKKRDAIDLPPVMYVERPITLPPDAMAVYRNIEDDFTTMIEAGTISVPNALVELLRLQQVTSGHVTTDAGEFVRLHHAKTEDLLEVMDMLGPGEPLVVFCRFTPDLAAVHEAAKQAGRKCAEVSGRVNQWEAFQFSEEFDTIAVQMQAGSEGIDLFRAAYAYDYSLGFSHSQFVQSRARLDRNGQTRPVTFFQPVATGTVDEKVYAKIGKVEKIVESIIEDRRNAARPRAHANA